MKTTKYEIELPTVPDGFEVVGNGKYRHGDLRLCLGTNVEAKWYWGCGGEGVNYAILARRKRTLAEWANEQPLFKALAEMRNMHDTLTNIYHIGDGLWVIRNEPFNLGTPPRETIGKLTLKNGKWEDAP